MSWQSLQRAVNHNPKLSFEEAKEHYENLTVSELYRLREYAKRNQRWLTQNGKFLGLTYEKMMSRPIEDLRHAFINSPRHATIPGRIINILIGMGVTKISGIKKHHINAIPHEAWRTLLSEALEFIGTRIVHVYCPIELFDRMDKKDNIQYIHLDSLDDIEDKHIIVADSTAMDIVVASRCKSISVLDRHTLKIQRYTINQSQPLKDMQCLKPQSIK